MSTGECPRSFRRLTSPGSAASSPRTRATSPARMASNNPVPAVMWSPHPPRLPERDTLAERDCPPFPCEPRPEPVADRQLRDLSIRRARGAEAQRQPDIAALPGALVRVPRPAVVQERRHPYAQQPPQIVLHEDAMLERQPRHPGPRQLVGTEQAGPVLIAPQIELRAGVGAAQRTALEVQHGRLPRQA